MQTIKMSFAASLNYKPPHPERTAQRSHSGMDMDVTFQTWPNRAAMLKTLICIGSSGWFMSDYPSSNTCKINSPSYNFTVPMNSPSVNMALPLAIVCPVPMIVIFLGCNSRAGSTSAQTHNAPRCSPHESMMASAGIGIICGSPLIAIGYFHISLIFLFSPAPRRIKPDILDDMTNRENFSNDRREHAQYALANSSNQNP